MFIVGLGTATPPWRYTQRECWEWGKSCEAVRKLSSRSQAILKKVLLRDNGIVARHLALRSLDAAFELAPDAMHARFSEHAPTLATAAAECALQDAGLVAAEMDGLIISTCTGYLCPGLTSYVSERLGLRTDALLLDLVGQGCGAALPNLRTAEALLAAGRAQRVLSVCVEVCSAAFYLDDDPGVLISACLFGDGAGAAVLSNQAQPTTRRIKCEMAGGTLSAPDRDYLRFEHRNGLLRNILAKEVPELAGKHAETVLAEVLARAGLSRDAVSAWILHPGGREILVALGERLELSQADLRWSAEILSQYGNLSSASVFFVLSAARAAGAPKGHWWMSSFGAGFSCHGALLEVE